MVILNLLYLAVIWVCIIDISGFAEEMKGIISKILTKGKIEKIDWNFKPIFCSLCMNFYSGLAYLLITGHFSLMMLAILLLISVSVGVIKDLIYLVLDLFSGLINWINKKL